MKTVYVVVLALRGEDGEGEGRESWHPCGEIAVALGTKIATVVERVLEGQIDGDAVGNGVPQLPLEDGDDGELLLIPAADIVARLPVQARRRFVVEPTAQGSEG